MANRTVLVLKLAAVLALALALFIGRKERHHAAIRLWQGFLFGSFVLGLIGSLDLGDVLTLSLSILSLAFALVAIVAAVVALKQRVR